ncbi:MAG: hypothetical protein KA502_00660 [Candidatus Methanomethylophilaceae archaeon]|nr:hypothetical protein [Candidatus Methanomethylophilaceae archaeon]
MAEKKRLRMRGVKQTPKRLEEEILNRSKRLAENPGLLRPMCAGNCKRCAFDKTFKEIDSFAKYKNDPDALLKLASRGSDDIAKAYAGTISLAAAGKIPMLATANLAGEKVPFAVRGSVGNDKLIGCQYYDDPRIRLLLYNNVIKKNGLFLYSFDNGLVCSDTPNMPEDYLYEAFWSTPYEFKDDGLDCGHDKAVSLVITIKSRDESIRICEDCAKDVSTAQFLISKICAVDPMTGIEVAVQHKYHAAGETGVEKITGTELDRYLRGEIGDRVLIQSVKNSKLGSLKSSEKATYVIGAKNYGSDLTRFMADLAGSEREKGTLSKFLTSHPRSVILRNGKASEALSSLWESDWNGLIAAHTSDKVAAGYKEKPKSAFDLVLEEAYQKFISEDVVASLPVFNKPKPVTKLADGLAKAAKVDGLDFVLKTVAGEALKNSKEKCLAASFILACDKGAKLPMNVSAEEMSFVQFLIPFARAVIDAGGDKYRDAMNTLLTACGSGESV